MYLIYAHRQPKPYETNSNTINPKVSIRSNTLQFHNYFPNEVWEIIVKLQITIRPKALSLIVIIPSKYSLREYFEGIINYRTVCNLRYQIKSNIPFGNI